MLLPKILKMRYARQSKKSHSAKKLHWPNCHRHRSVIGWAGRDGWRNESHGLRGVTGDTMSDVRDRRAGPVGR